MVRKIFKNRRAQVGIGTLIIFIAMILVAAVAAGVLLRTSGSLQQKATVTGEQAQKEVSTNIKVTNTVGYTNSTNDNDVKALVLTAQLASGSGDVKYSDIVLTYQEGDTYVAGISYESTIGLNTALYTKNITNSTTGEWNTTGIEEYDNSTGTDSDKGQFYIRELKEDSPSNSVLEAGEIIELLYWVEKQDGSDVAIDPGDEWIVTIQPKAGQTTTLTKTVPSVISQQYITEWGT